MSVDTEARYLFRRAREETAKTNAALARHASEAEVAAHRELALRYKVRALAAASPDQVLCDAMEKFNANGQSNVPNEKH